MDQRNIYILDKNSPRRIYWLFVSSIDSKGTILLIDDVDVENYWNSLDEPVDTIIEIYHKHATCERFHSELKSDLDIERLPSRKFKADVLVLELAAFTYNVLRIIDQQFLNSSSSLSSRINVSRSRMKTLLKRIIFIAGLMFTTARETFFRINHYTKRTSYINENVLEIWMRFNFCILKKYF